MRLLSQLLISCEGGVNLDKLVFVRGESVISDRAGLRLSKGQM